MIDYGWKGLTDKILLNDPKNVKRLRKKYKSFTKNLIPFVWNPTPNMRNEIIAKNLILGLKNRQHSIYKAMREKQYNNELTPELYKEDLKDIKEEIKKLIEKGEYPDKLWK